MSSDVDQLERAVRDAGAWPVPELDMSAVGARARRRRHRRRGGMLAAFVALVCVLGLVVAVWSDPTERGRVGVAGRAADVTWTPIPMPRDATGIRGVAGGLANGSGTIVAVGASGDRDRPPVATIWRSGDDGATWTVAYSNSEIVADDLGVPLRPAVSLSAAYYLDGYYVVTGDVAVPGEDYTIGGVWISTDTTTWTRADSDAFVASVPVRVRNDSVVQGSRIYDVTRSDDRFVAVGDVFADAPAKVQEFGLSPATWTSSDGITWTRRIPDLGPGYDPYMYAVTGHGSQLVGSGTADVWPGLVWTTDNQRTWTRHTITDHGRARVERVPGGYVAAGSENTGPHRRRVNPQRQSGIPTIWWSDDLDEWDPVLTLPERHGPNANVGFTAAAAHRLVVATGPIPGDDGPTTSRLYASRDGRAWGRVTIPGVTATKAVVLGTGYDSIYLDVYAPPPSGEPLIVWRVFATPPTTNVTITGLPTLRFDADTYTVDAGDVRLGFATAGGTHRLRIDARALRDVSIDTYGPDAAPTVSKRLHLEPGQYTIYCDVPGHRAAGMEATLIATDPDQ